MSKSISIDDLENKLIDQQQEVLQTKRAINLLCSMLGEEPRYEEVLEVSKAKSNTKRDEYFNKPLATSVKMFLEKRGEAATVNEIIDELKAGGFDIGNEKFADRNIRISLAKNTALFAYIKANDSFGLRKAYGMKIKEKIGKSEKQSKRSKNGKNATIESPLPKQENTEE